MILVRLAVTCTRLASRRSAVLSRNATGRLRESDGKDLRNVVLFIQSASNNIIDGCFRSVKPFAQKGSL